MDKCAQGEALDARARELMREDAPVEDRRLFTRGGIPSNRIDHQVHRMRAPETKPIFEHEDAGSVLKPPPKGFSVDIL
ncbi:hypothetical protein TcasGA2_TC007408 [Tribolium castaneum]|uniref:Uncharacterized protein n=1 Tax=Tribolium castaneum TaxID=7070 RepID=D1ZZR6_TRICA|nr:hypothetical protein TcasGA2_TC007408 [Tribolium castaneum]